jgi:hypothetical protein
VVWEDGGGNPASYPIAHTFDFNDLYAHRNPLVFSTLKAVCASFCAYAPGMRGGGIVPSWFSPAHSEMVITPSAEVIGLFGETGHGRG